jgi:hypothetical protein
MLSSLLLKFLKKNNHLFYFIFKNNYIKNHDFLKILSNFIFKNPLILNFNILPYFYFKKNIVLEMYFKNFKKKKIKTIEDSIYHKIFIRFLENLTQQKILLV